MNFEEYIKSKKKELLPNEINPSIWENIETRLDTVNSPSHRFNRIASIIGVTLLAASIIFYLDYSNKNKSKEILDSENYALKRSMTTLLNDDSSLRRIMAVNMSNEMQSPNAEIINLLIDVIENDESTKVRIAAINAIEPFAYDEDVRVVLINELSKTTDSFVQVKIIKILLDYKEKRSIPVLNRLLQDEDQKNYVKEEARIAKETLQII